MRWKWTLIIFARSLDFRRRRKTFLPLKDWSRRKGRVQWPGAAEEVLVPWRFCHNTQPAAAAATRAFSGKRREVAAAAAPKFPRRGPDLPERCLPFPLPHMECPLDASVVADNLRRMFEWYSRTSIKGNNLSFLIFAPVFVEYISTAFGLDTWCRL